MTKPQDAVVSAVRREIADVGSDGGVLIACSGGADSLALAAAAARVGRGASPPAFVGAVVVDHSLQEDSEAVAHDAAATCRGLGLAPVEVVRAEVSGGGGVEAAARRARYRALATVAAQHEAVAVLLGHTQEDQAETVLVGLTRGSGPRVLAGMPRRNGIFRRPLLNLPRATVRSAFPELQVWHDPHNEDPQFRRSVVRHRLLPTLIETLGPGVVAALARSAALTRAETEALDVWSERLIADAVRVHEDQVAIDAAALAVEPQAVVARVVLAAAAAAGSPQHRLTATHVSALTDLVGDWRGQGELHLPGGVIAHRCSGTVVLRRVDLDRCVDSTHREDDCGTT